MKKIILVSSFLCSFVTMHAQDANRKDKSNAASTQKTSTIATPAPALEPVPVLTIDASAVRNGSTLPVAPAMGGILTIDASQPQNVQEQKNKVQQAPSKK